MSQTAVGSGASGRAVRIAAVVVTHDRLAQLQRTIERLLGEAVDHVIVVDNASTDGTGAWLDGLKDVRLHPVRLTHNSGGAGGFEEGLRRAVALYDPDWCVVMDDDARPAPGAVAQFRADVAGAQAPGFDAVSAGVFYPGGAICEMNRPSFNPFWDLKSFLRTLFGGGRRGFHVSDASFEKATLQRIDACSFVGLFLSRRAIQKVGYPDGRLFIYADDVLYTLKITRAGGAIGFAPWLRFEHDCTTVPTSGPIVHRPLWKVYYTYRNGLLAYREAAGPLWFWPVLVVVAVKWRRKARLYGPDRASYLRLLRLALADALRGRLGRSHAEVMARSLSSQFTG